MKNRLEKKLKSPKIDRKFKWFWINYVKKTNSITYPYFMDMLNGNVNMRADVKETIESYLKPD